MKLLVMKMTERKEKNFRKICEYFPVRVRETLAALPDERIRKLCEIRIRAEKPVVLVFTDGTDFITCSGRLTEFISNNLLCVTERETAEIFNSMCRYSVHSLTDNIAQGFITLDGGCRAGVYGTAVTDRDRVISVRSIKGMNIRISGDFPDVAKPIVEKICGEKANILICGPPASGKTTVMLDLCRILSDEKRMKVCIVDERSESDGGNTGLNTDVLSGYPKAVGIEIAVRTLSPDIIAFDEIGSTDEVQAVKSGLNSGVKFVMTIHCADKYELAAKPQYKILSEYNAVDYCVFLKETGKIDEILRTRELKNENCRLDGAGTCLRPYGSIHSLQA